MVPVCGAERILGPVVPECGARDNGPGHIEASVAQLCGDSISCVAAIIVVDRSDLKLKIRMTRLLQQRVGRVFVDHQRCQLGILWVDRADVVVFSQCTLTVDAKIQQNLWVNRHGDGATNADIIIRCVVLVWTDHNGCRCDHGASGPADRVEQVDELTNCLIGHVKFTGFGSGQPCGWILTKVDEVDLIQIGITPVSVTLFA